MDLNGPGPNPEVKQHKYMTEEAGDKERQQNQHGKCFSKTRAVTEEHSYTVSTKATDYFQMQYGCKTY